VARPRVVIIGAGAAGVFTAYRLRQMAGDAFEIVLLEESDRVGGNARSTTVQFGGEDYSIDCGAQFFYRNPQPGYVALLADLGLFDAPSQIDARATGITIWDRQIGEPRLWIPSHLTGFLRYRARDWERLIGFATFLVYASLLERNRPDDWTLSLDDWADGLTLLDSEFKDEVLRSFLYQFVTLPSDRIGEASALYAITYFVRNAFGEPGGGAPDPGIADPPGPETFEVYQSRIGLDAIIERALQAAAVTPRLNEPVTAVTRTLDGTLEVTTVTETIPAGHVVFATDPQTAATVLTAGSFPAPQLIASLQQCEYDDLVISMQSGGSCWMPDVAEFWESVNTIVDGDALQFSAWFGPLRDPDSGGKKIPVFKSWASPDVDPARCEHTFLTLSHRILMPTTTFMTHRQAVQGFQGNHGLWFAGGWTNWFDSQESALDSATDVASRVSGVRPSRRAAAPVDSDRQRERINRWLTRIAAAAPAARRHKLRNLLNEIETKG
jgi:predicted NAD/FAD-binding protein